MFYYKKSVINVRTSGTKENETGIGGSNNTSDRMCT